jgi:hypothetical protein
MNFQRNRAGESILREIGLGHMELWEAKRGGFQFTVSYDALHKLYCASYKRRPNEGETMFIDIGSDIKVPDEQPGKTRAAYSSLANACAACVAQYRLLNN